MRPFKPSWGVLLVLFSASCTERNPDFCGDKTCVDPAKPYCDYYGEIGGMPGTCIAVQCSPGELAVCHSDTAVTCNSDGNNYEQLQCALGCDPVAGGCRQCVKNDQCTGGLVCDTSSSSCRPCQLDAECDSKVCDLEAGTCIDQSKILYASPDGPSGTTALCSLAQPCDVSTAITTATSSLSSRIVRMLPGSYVFPVKVEVPNGALTVVATGANIAVVGDVAAVVVNGGASVNIRGLSSTSERHLQCGLMASGSSTLQVTDAAFTTPGNAMNGSGTAIELRHCAATLRRVTLTAGSTTILATGDDSNFDGDQIQVRPVGSNSNTIVAAGARSHVRITNSTFANTDVITFFSDSGAPGSSLEFAYDTFAIFDGLEVCSGTYPSGAAKRVIENSIIAASGTFDALKNASPGGCTLTSTILTHQSSPPLGAIVADPRLVDPASSDLRLQTGSPAVDAATTGTLPSSHDVDGTLRPIGGAPDIGAYELQH